MTYEDIGLDGDVDARVVETRLANGTDVSFYIDRDGDGSSEVIRKTITHIEADGDRVTTFTESHTPISSEYGAGRLAHKAQTTTSADGLSSITLYDIDGDGTWDGSSTSTTTYHLDGRRTDVRETRYADDSLRERLTVSNSADGRRVTEIADYDGNGLADKIVERVVGADRTVTGTEAAFNQAGIRGQLFVTTTSADGLTTTIARSSGVQTISRSVLENGTYNWDNGLTPAAWTPVVRLATSHTVDALGFETWTFVQSWYNNAAPQTQTYTTRLDAEAKAAIMAEAARLFDTIFDRDMDVIEAETLVAYVANGELKRSDLAGALLSSTEFSTRYGTLSNAEFVAQLYLNTYSRSPTLAEMNRDLRALAAGTMTRTQMAVQIAETIEHVVTGNEHIATNNFDTIMNPVVFDRFLDRAYVESLVRALVDTAYDRDATAQEVAYLSGEMLKGTWNLDDLAAVLLSSSGELHGVGVKSLQGLSGAALVGQVFVNALGRQPSAAELQAWTENLSAGRITAAQFMATLATSVEKTAAGNGHEPITPPTVTPGWAIPRTIPSAAATGRIRSTAGAATTASWGAMAPTC